MAKHPEFSNDRRVNILRNAVDPLRLIDSSGQGALTPTAALSVEVPLPIAKLICRHDCWARRHSGERVRESLCLLFVRVRQREQLTNWMNFIQHRSVEQSILFENLYTGLRKDFTH